MPAPWDMQPWRWEQRLYAVRIQAGWWEGTTEESRGPHQARTLRLFPKGNGTSTAIFSRQEKTMLRLVAFERSFW